MERKYPLLSSATSAPFTGNMFYSYLLDHLGEPGRLKHEAWYETAQDKLANPKSPFRGGMPIGETLEMLVVDGRIIKGPYTFTGNETQPVFVNDLSVDSQQYLGLPDSVIDDKVFDPKFRPYEELSESIRKRDEVITLSFAKSVSGHFGQRGKPSYSERDIIRFLNSCFNDLSCKSMMHILQATHMMESAFDYLENREVQDVAFHSFGTPDAYLSQVNSVLPSMFFTLQCLNEDPRKYERKLDNSDFETQSIAQKMTTYSRQGNLPYKRD